MYDFLTGPALWASLAIFAIGALVRVIWYLKGLDWKLDRVAYTKFPAAGLKGALRSIGRWLIPFGTHRWQTQPGMAILFFAFHIGLVVTPLFLLAHTVLLKEWQGLPWLSIPNSVADVLTVMVILAGLGLALRRLTLPEVRILTSGYDYLLLAISMAPFVTGFLAAQEVGNYEFWLLTHIICGEIMLIAIPFTRLSHVVLFFCSRGQLGADFGIKRGGLKGKGMPW